MPRIAWCCCPMLERCLMLFWWIWYHAIVVLFMVLVVEPLNPHACTDGAWVCQSLTWSFFMSDKEIICFFFLLCSIFFVDIFQASAYLGSLIVSGQTCKCPLTCDLRWWSVSDNVDQFCVFSQWHSSISDYQAVARNFCCIMMLCLLGIIAA